MTCIYTLYVGSPNKIHSLSDDLINKIKSITSEYFESYTYVKAKGVFENTEEDVLMITIANASKADVYELGQKLRALLGQDGVSVEHNGVYEKLITD